jgi:hypothetical protein
MAMAYGVALSKDQLRLALQDYAGWDLQTFQACVAMHRVHPERGRFYPLLADLNFQRIGGREHVHERAELEFEANPLIDGTPSHQVRTESVDDRERRRARWIKRSLARFEIELRERGPDAMEYSGPGRLLPKGGSRGSH